MNTASSAHFDPAIPVASEAPQSQGAAAQDHRRLRPRHPASGGYFAGQIDALSEAQLTE
jgi:hypothetical protein